MRNLVLILIASIALAISGCTAITAVQAAPSVPVEGPANPTAEEAVPAAETEAPAKTTCEDVDFSSWVGNTYGLISLLDAQTDSTPQNSTEFTLYTKEPVLYWTGNYNAGTAPSGFERLIVDGDTGVFCVPSGTEVTVNFVGKYLELARFNLAVTPNEVDDVADGTMPVAIMAQLLNKYGRADSERFFRELDSATNVEAAPYLSARYRPEPLGPKTYTNLLSGSAVFWVQEGRVGGTEGIDYVVLVSSHGKWAVLNLTDTLELEYAHTGVQLDGGLDLASLVEWWGGGK